MAEPRTTAPKRGHLGPSLLFWPLRLAVRSIIELFLFGGHLHLEGADNVPRQGGLLVISNHIAGADPPLLGTCFPRPLHFMAKAEWFRTPLLGFISRVFLC
ncbi:MAG: 1-acyl-sn-glycerol-3-phosphate acyltransferase, partial [Candidatus Dormibacteraeota bacterium]|nr:1-acyl-sn-glycerol-3-phosphate acyltransferase [Candidatus Dormibacteraeota bacterium]